MIEFTLADSNKLLTKELLIDGTGALRKTVPSHHIIKSTRMSVETLSEAMDIFDRMAPTQCAILGVHKDKQHVSLNVDTQERVKNGLCALGTISRTLDCFAWSNQQGLLCIDIDIEHEPQEAYELICTAFDMAFGRHEDFNVRDVEMVYRPSASSGYYTDITKPSYGGRFYCVVERAEDIPAVGKGIYEALWALGQGRYDASKAGTALDRTLIDASVWSPERLDFVAAATISPEYKDRIKRGNVQYIKYGKENVRINLIGYGIMPDVSRLAATARRNALEEAKDILAEKRKEYIEEKLTYTVSNMIVSGHDNASIEKFKERQHEMWKHAVEHHLLDSDFMIFLDSQMRVGVTVGEIFENPEKYHGVKCCDPLEPEFSFGKAKIFTNGKFLISSFKHGRQIYDLYNHERAMVLIKDSDRAAEQISDIVTAMKKSFGNLFFKMDKTLVYVGNGSLQTIDMNQLIVKLSERITFFEYKGKDRTQNVALPKRIAEQFIACLYDDTLINFPTINQVINKPMFYPETGEIISDFGFHEPSKTYLYADDDFGQVIDIGSKAEAIRIATELLEPYIDVRIHVENVFHRNAVILALILSACARNSIVCPVPLFAASRAGTGKSYTSAMLAAELGERPNFIAGTTNKDEMDKIVPSVLRKPNVSHAIFDNVDGCLQSNVIEQVVDKDVSDNVESRILGHSLMASMVNNKFILVNGNNLHAVTEAMSRRTLPITFCAEDDGENIWAGKLTLAYAPRDFIINNWAERHTKAMSLLRWSYLNNSTFSKPKGNTINSIASYDKYIRKMVFDLYGYDVCQETIDSVQEAVNNGAGSEIKSKLFMAAWIMCWRHSNNRDGLIINSKNVHKLTSLSFNFGLSVADDDIALARIEWGDMSEFRFTLPTLERFIATCGISKPDLLIGPLKTKKLLNASGKFNGMQLIKTDEKDYTNVPYWKICFNPSVNITIA